MNGTEDTYRMNPVRSLDVLFRMNPADMNDAEYIAHMEQNYRRAHQSRAY